MEARQIFRVFQAGRHRRLSHISPDATPVVRRRGHWVILSLRSPSPVTTRTWDRRLTSPPAHRPQAPLMAASSKCMISQIPQAQPTSPAATQTVLLLARMVATLWLSPSQAITRTWGSTATPPPAPKLPAPPKAASSKCMIFQILQAQPTSPAVMPAVLPMASRVPPQSTPSPSPAITPMWLLVVPPPALRPQVPPKAASSKCMISLFRPTLCTSPAVIHRVTARAREADKSTPSPSLAITRTRGSTATPLPVPKLQVPPSAVSSWFSIFPTHLHQPTSPAVMCRVIVLVRGISQSTPSPSPETMPMWGRIPVPPPVPKLQVPPSAVSSWFSIFPTHLHQPTSPAVTQTALPQVPTVPRSPLSPSPATTPMWGRVPTPPPAPKRWEVPMVASSRCMILRVPPIPPSLLVLTIPVL